jgi:omega-6 fatty acid desaturase (delta-12 desaturase)
MRPRLVDERLRSAAFTLGDARRAIPRHCFVRSPWRAWWSLARIAGSCAVSLWLLSLLPLTWGPALLWQLPLHLLLWTAYGWVLVGLFLIGHDCGHGSFSSSRAVNAVVGWMCLTPLANSYYTWKLTHERHHAFTQLRGHDIDWARYLVTREEFEAGKPRPGVVTRLGYAIPCGIFLWIAWNTVRRASMLHTMFTDRRLAREWRRLLWSNVAMACALLILYGALWYWTGLMGMLKYHGIPATMAMVTSWVIITIQHANEHGLWYEEQEWTPLRGQFVGTFDVRFPRWLEYVWCYGNVHIPHHVAPAIPWYHLKDAALALKHAYPDYYQEMPFTPAVVRWMWKTPFLRKVEERRYYVLAAPGDASALT